MVRVVTKSSEILALLEWSTGTAWLKSSGVASGFSTVPSSGMLAASSGSGAAAHQYGTFLSRLLHVQPR